MDARARDAGPLITSPLFGTNPDPRLTTLPCGGRAQGGEIDVGAGRCHMMEAIEMKGTKALRSAPPRELDRAPP